MKNLFNPIIKYIRSCSLLADPSIHFLLRSQTNQLKLISERIEAKTLKGAHSNIHGLTPSD